MPGRKEAARSAVAEALRIDPRISLKAYAAYVCYYCNADPDRDLTAFRKAALPEKLSMSGAGPGVMGGVLLSKVLKVELPGFCGEASAYESKGVYA